MTVPPPQPPGDEWPTLLVSLVALLGVLLMPMQCTQAQPTGTWTTYVEETETTVWLVIEPPTLVVINQKRDGSCMAVPARVRWEGGQPVQREWTVRQDGDTLTVDLPATATTQARTMTYVRTNEDPLSFCTDSQKI